MALLLMLVGTVLAMSALHVARSDFEANRAVRLSHAALRAAEAGGYRTLIRWADTGADALVPGDSADTGWRTLPGGGAYRTVVLRVDDGGGTPRYRLRTAGRPGRASTAQRVLYTMVEGGGGGGGGGGAAVAGAVTIQGRLRILGGGPWAQVDGADRIPPGWDAFCAAGPEDGHGVRITDRDDLIFQGPALVYGDPATQEDPSLGNDDFATIAGRPYADMAAGADVPYASNTNINSAIGPQVTGGECDESAPLNWGDPSGGPCGDYLPVIHVAGNLSIGSGGRGQGVILVDGNLTIDGPFEFTGLVVVLGSVDLGNQSEITGGLMVRNGASGNGQSEIGMPAQVLYSACAVARVAGGSSGAPRLMAGRHWFDIG